MKIEGEGNRARGGRGRGGGRIYPGINQLNSEQIIALRATEENYDAATGASHLFGGLHRTKSRRYLRLGESGWLEVRFMMVLGHDFSNFLVPRNLHFSFN